MDLREIGWESVDWVHLAQDRDQWQALVKKKREMDRCSYSGMGAR
jgi:hypothetical protein